MSKPIDACRTLTVNDQSYDYFSLEACASEEELAHLPISLKILLENALRHQATHEQINAILERGHDPNAPTHAIYFHPARVLLQDFTGVPVVCDLAAMRDAALALGHDPQKINPCSQVDLVIDHSVQVTQFGDDKAFDANVKKEIQLNSERYEFLRWGGKAFTNFNVVPPGTGICHQVNLEYLAKVVWTETTDEGKIIAYPDTLVGTDSHTTMINGLSVLGWGVGGIEAEAAMLGQPVSMTVPDVIGFKLTGRLKEGIMATDLVLTITQMLRQKGVVGKFVEFFGSGLNELPLADRATIANMAPEYGATCGFFPVDEKTIDYLKLSGRDEKTIELVKAYAQTQTLWRHSDSPDPLFKAILELNLGDVAPCLAGPSRPQDRVTLTELPSAFEKVLAQPASNKTVDVGDFSLTQGDVVIAAITSCTNTSNPSVLMAAALLAKKAVEAGLTTKPWVKTSLAPGSKVVTDYLEKAGLQTYLDQLGFNLVGYGCTTCIGNSGPLPDPVSKAIDEGGLEVCAVLSGNRNFEGRIHPQVKASWLASPPLVVAFALAGNTRCDLTTDPIGTNVAGQSIYLKDLWPSNDEVADAVRVIDHAMFRQQYADVFKGDDTWQAIKTPDSATYTWRDDSTYVAKPPFLETITATPDPIKAIKQARIIALLGDSITTDHISPAGVIKPDSPAGHYLQAQGVPVEAFNSYGSRRGNHEVMMRGTFANIRIRNEMVPDKEGGFTYYLPDNQVVSIYDAAMHYRADKTPLVVIAGKEYGTGSSRDWAAKGTLLLGIKAVIAESFERIHRSNLVGMGVLPLQFTNGITRKSLQLTGKETVDIALDDHMTPQMLLEATITNELGNAINVSLLCRIDTEDEISYYQQGGILPYVLRKMQ